MFTLAKLNETTADFQKFVEPQLYSSKIFDPANSYVVLCEGDTDDLKTKMDIYAGIDMCTIDKAHQVVQGIASRVQRGNCWRTFTIRAVTDYGSFDTELKKRTLAIRNGDMYPTWTIQSYISDSINPDSKICTVGIVRTVDLFNYVGSEISRLKFKNMDEFFDALHNWSNIGELDVRRNYTGGAVFLSCNWDRMKNHGIEIRILSEEFDI